MRNIHEIIIRPLLTEKSTEQLDQKNAYTFVVGVDANKIEIADAIQRQFDVTVKSVRTMRYAGKERRVGRFVGRRASWKKAVVTLKAGDTIEIFEGV
ncbi:MAG: 50S ribosomal protein L23 [Gemmatimonadota bacterium]|jgi:large subunit ribosomal protein L23|nr:50S ribosomal protein L23 [Gemmatimonadota bacterium]